MTRVLGLVLFCVLTLLGTGCAGQRREAFVRDHPSLSAQSKQDILKGVVRIGMTKVMVIASFGQPQRVHRTVMSDRIMEQWVYEENVFEEHGLILVYFERGKVTAFQE